MVDRHLCARAKQSVRGFSRGPGRPAAGAGAAICRLRGVATEVDGRRRDPEGTGAVLEGELSGGTGAVGVAVGPCEAGATELYRRVEPIRAGRELGDRAERAKPAAWGDVIHDIAGRVGGPDGTVIGAGGGGDRDSNSQPGKSGD